MADLRESTPPPQAASIDTLSVDNLQGSTPLAVSNENVPRLVTPPMLSSEAEIQSGHNFEGSIPPTNTAETTEAVPTKEGFIGPV